MPFFRWVGKAVGQELPKRIVNDLWSLCFSYRYGLSANLFLSFIVEYAADIKQSQASTRSSQCLSKCVPSLFIDYRGVFNHIMSLLLLGSPFFRATNTRVGKCTGFYQLTKQSVSDKAYPSSFSEKKTKDSSPMKGNAVLTFLSGFLENWAFHTTLLKAFFYHENI